MGAVCEVFSFILEIPAAGQQAKVFVNGEFVVSHEGAIQHFEPILRKNVRKNLIR